MLSCLPLIARYYYDCGFSKKEIRYKLEECLLKSDSHVNLVRLGDFIDGCVKECNKRKLIDISYIPITRKEFEVCRALRAKEKSKLMFTLICLSKYYLAVSEKYNGWITMDDSDIFALANIKRSTKARQLYFNELMQGGLISFSKKVNSISINVNAIEDGKDDVIYKVTNMRDLGNQFECMNGSDYIACKICGRLVRRNCNHQKLCPECANTDISRVSKASMRS